MYDLFMGLGALSALAVLYFLLGLLVPRLPFVRTRKRAGMFFVASLVVTFVFSSIADATLTPERRQQLAAERTAKAQQEAQQRANEDAEAARKKSAERAASSAAVADRMAEERAATAEKWASAEVDLGTLLSAYKNNEIAADSRFKGERIQVTGIVGDVKKDILGDPYVTVGSGKDFEIPVVQCFLARGEEAAAARLNKGQQVTVRGRVSGLMMNVLVKECEVR